MESAMHIDAIRKSAGLAVTELLDIANLHQNELLVIGCSSSEIVGGKIGKSSSLDAARAVWDGISPVLKERGIFLAVQCCEHLNRALILEKDAARMYGYDEVNVIPHPHAGGAFAATAYERMTEPVAVEAISAHAGMDIGDTLIGMHLRSVAVPVRLSVTAIGDAHLVCARTRAKYIGGERAHYKQL